MNVPGNQIQLLFVTSSLPRAFIVAGFLTLLASGALFASFGALFPGLQQHFSLSESQVGVLVTMISVGGIIGSSVIGFAETLLPLRWRVLGGNLLAAIGIEAMAVSNAWWLMLVSGLITGIGTAILNVEINSRFARGFGERSAAMVTLGSATFSIGAILGPFAVSFNPDEPRYLFLVLQPLSC